MPTFLVERYRPGVSGEDVAGLIERDVEAAETMRREGKKIRIVSSTFVETDEVVLSMVEAESEAEIRDLGERSGTPVDRVIRATDVLPARSSSGSRS